MVTRSKDDWSACLQIATLSSHWWCYDGSPDLTLNSQFAERTVFCSSSVQGWLIGQYCDIIGNSDSCRRGCKVWLQPNKNVIWHGNSLIWFNIFLQVRNGTMRTNASKSDHGYDHESN
jgi:hypothetical protein